MVGWLSWVGKRLAEEDADPFPPIIRDGVARRRAVTVSLLNFNIVYFMLSLQPDQPSRIEAQQIPVRA